MWRDTVSRCYRFAVCLTALMFLVAAPAMTASFSLYGTIGNGPSAGGSGAISTLVELDPVTGALLNSIGSVGYIVNGLAWDPTSGYLYGSTSVQDPGHNGLIRINRTTGAGTPIGPSGWSLSGDTAVTNITTNSSGQMYGWLESQEDDLVSISKAAGTAVRVGESGVATGQSGLAFNPADTLYLVNGGGDYYIVNTATGAATSAGNIGQTAHHGVFHPLTGLYYGLGPGWPGLDGNRTLVVVDLATGTVLSSVSTEDFLHTLAFVAIPEPGTVALVALGLAGLALIRRRRPKP